MKDQGGRRKAEGGKSKRKSALHQKRPAKPSTFKIDATNQQARWPVKISQLESALRSVLEGERIGQADISLAIVDDPTIHQINKQFLEHDEPTDVISFLLEQEGNRLDGDILISADTAAHSADEYSWNLADELLLYAIHGMLHLVGYDDLAPAKKRQMRQKERHYLAKFGLKPRYKLNSGSRGGEEKTPVTRTRAKTDGRKRARRSK